MAQPKNGRLEARLSYRSASCGRRRPERDSAACTGWRTADARRYKIARLRDARLSMGISTARSTARNGLEWHLPSHDGIRLGACTWWGSF